MGGRSRGHAPRNAASIRLINKSVSRSEWPMSKCEGQCLLLALDNEPLLGAGLEIVELLAETR